LYYILDKIERADFSIMHQDNHGNPNPKVQLKIFSCESPKELLIFKYSEVPYPKHLFCIVGKMDLYDELFTLILTATKCSHLISFSLLIIHDMTDFESYVLQSLSYGDDEWYLAKTMDVVYGEKDTRQV
jgi:hypothetical protein